jgi:chromosome segregation ATPase
MYRYKMAFSLITVADITMKTKHASTVLVFLILMVPNASAWSPDREMVQLESQLEALQDQTTRMQQAFDERVGSIHSLNEKNADAINKLLTTITRLQAAIDREHVDSANRRDRISGQIQELNDNLDELKARLAKVSKQLQDIDAMRQDSNMRTQKSADHHGRKRP